MLVFATGNKKKIKEAESILSDFKINFSAKSAEVDEIQHPNPQEITKAKALEIYKKLLPEFGENLELLVHDSSWDIPVLNGFPGGYMKDVLTWSEPEDFLNLMNGKEDRRAIAKDNLIYFDGKEMKLFSNDIHCTILKEARGKSLSSWEKVCSVYGGKSISENWDNNVKYDDEQKRESFNHWIDFAKWYKEENENN